VTSFLEKENLDLTLLFIRKKEEGTTIKTASEREIQEIYDNGVDVFFNLETYS